MSHVDLSLTLQRETNASRTQARLAIEILCRLGTLRERLETLQRREETLRQKPRCCGRIIHQQEPPRPYATHSVADDCPFPGHEPAPDQRRGPRRYVRQAQLAAVRQAMATWDAWSATQRELVEAQQAHDEMLARLREVLTA